MRGCCRQQNESRLVLEEADNVIRQLEQKVKCAEEQNDRLREELSQVPPAPMPSAPPRYPPLAFSPSSSSTPCLQPLLIIQPLPSAPPHHPPLAFSPSALAASSCPCNSSSLPFVFMRATLHLSRSLLRRSSPDAAVSLALSRC
jgi:hypothetical protein